VVVIAALAWQLKLTSFEIIELGVLAAGALQLYEIVKAFKIFEILLRKVMSSADHMEFSTSNSAGNMVKITRGILEKVSYIELRLMHLTADRHDMERQLYQVILEPWGAQV
jgi:hypothetical protein